MVEYSKKFLEHRAKLANFNKLSKSLQEFLEQKADNYRLSFQDLKALVDIAIDLNMWQEGSLIDIWEDKRDKKETIKSIKSRYEDIRAKRKSYSNFRSNKRQ